jgi:hypothetical protein
MTMSLYEFEMIFSLAGSFGDPDDIVNALFEAGCDDAIIGVAKRDRIGLGFAREAKSAGQAMAAAEREVRKALSGAELIEVRPDLVNLSDMAERLGYSRQNMQKYASGNGGSFPHPAHVGAPDVWHFYDVLLWLRDEKQVAVDGTLIEVSFAAAEINARLQSERLAIQQRRIAI